MSLIVLCVSFYLRCSDRSTLDLGSVCKVFDAHLYQSRSGQYSLPSELALEISCWVKHGSDQVVSAATKGLMAGQLLPTTGYRPKPCSCFTYGSQVFIAERGQLVLESCCSCSNRTLASLLNEIAHVTARIAISIGHNFLDIRRSEISRDLQTQNRTSSICVAGCLCLVLVST